MTKNIVLIPIDNRPVTFYVPKLVADIAGIHAALPPRELMGSLTKAAEVDKLVSWTAGELKKNPDALFICLDSLLYGGLITSRRGEETTSEIRNRLDALLSICKDAKAKMALYAQSSIMRISDNYDNTEEKLYWKDFGRELFAWSAALHKQELKKEESAIAQLEKKIPDHVRQDYLSTRKRNHEINLQLIELAEQGLFDCLIFSQDDSGEFGLNVSEKTALIELAKEKNVSDKTLAYAGADEVLCTLISRWLASEKSPKALVRFSTSGVSSCSSRYEGQTIGTSVANQMQAAGIQRVNGGADFFIVVHGNEAEQGDHIHLPGLEDKTHLNTGRSVKQTLEFIATSQYPIVLCDVAYANGSDPMLISELLERKDLLGKIWAYAGWNTTGNTLGSALAAGTAAWYAKQQGNLNADAIKLALFIRLLDDWAYQTQVRPKLNGKADAEKLSKLMKPYVEQIAKALDVEPKTNLSLTFPWQRTFEIEIA